MLQLAANLRDWLDLEGIISYYGWPGKAPVAFTLTVFLIVALVVAFLLMKGMQNPSAIREKAEQAATQAAQSAVDTVNHTVQEAMNDPSVQQSVNNLIQNIQDMVPQAEGQG